MYDPVWRAGFEVEVILGDLYEPAFEAPIEPMDVASQYFCQRVASRLRDCTGRPWSAPRKHPRKTGFFVVSEYDLDPIDWPGHRVAGVELLTPPLPLAEAQLVREEIVEAIEEIDGQFNFRRSQFTQTCAWHINIDAGNDARLDPYKYYLAVDELKLLVSNDRLFSRYSSSQRHSYGIPILRHLVRDPEGSLLRGTGLPNLLIHRSGHGKRFACNFAKSALGYVELRHFSAITFFRGPPLGKLIAPITRAFEMWAVEEDPPQGALIRRFQSLASWLNALRPRLTVEIGPFNTLAEGVLRLDGRRIGGLIWNGDAEVWIDGPGKHSRAATIWDVQLTDIPEAIALLAMDLVELTDLGSSRPVREKLLETALSDLSTKLSPSKMKMPAPDAKRRESCVGVDVGTIRRISEKAI